MEETQRALAQPAPYLSPDQVVLIQLQALQENDTPEPDSGIATTFRFASPSNQAATGPLPRFTLLVQGPLYRALLHFNAMQRGPLVMDGDAQATQSVLIQGADGKTAVYVWALSRQPSGPYEGCWMTDAVLRA